MKDFARAVNAHYSRTELGKSILAALERAGKDLSTLTRDDIALFDEFHIRGREATRELARLANLQAGATVLDLGSGIGGTARTLAAEFGSEVTGIDLIEEYCRAAQMLSEHLGESGGATFRQGNVLDMPFEDATFDQVWSQHVIVNIEDKARLFSQIRRVLRSGGRFVLHEICTGSVAPPHLPVPWASEPSISFLVDTQTMRRMLEEAGFDELFWLDVSLPSLEWFRSLIAYLAARPSDAPPPLGLNLLMGAVSADMIANLRRNLEEDRIRVVQGVLRRAD